MNLDVILSRRHLNACALKRKRYSVARSPTAADYAAIVDVRDLFWLLGALGIGRRRIVLAVCACVRWSLPWWDREYPDDGRPRRCIEVAEAWCRGQATIEEVHAAYAYAAYAAAYAAASAASAVSASSAAYVAAAASVAVSAVYASYTSASASAAISAASAAAAVSAAHTSALRDLADVVRQVVPWPLVRMRATELGLMEPVS